MKKLTLKGAFVASNAMASSDAKSSEMKLNRLILTKSLPLLVVGIIRWASTAAIGYHVDATEYGVHWNFFFSLFVVKVAGYFSTISKYIWLTTLTIGPILIRCFRRVPPLVLGIMLITAYEFILRYTGLDETILDRIHPRTTFFLQNKDRVRTKVDKFNTKIFFNATKGRNMQFYWIDSTLSHLCSNRKTFITFNRTWKHSQTVGFSLTWYIVLTMSGFSDDSSVPTVPQTADIGTTKPI